MIKCKTCGAEMQNPFDRYCETSIEWLHIHTNKPHELEPLTDNQKLMMDSILSTWKILHDKHGRRLDTI